jgi:hypothetical protein
MSKLLCGGLLAAGLLLLGAGCQPPTTFHGDPAFPGGAPACFEKCRRQNMEMASFVYVGAYSTACACKPRSASASVAEAEGGQAAIVAAAAGVEMQRRRMEEEQRAAAMRAK